MTPRYRLALLGVVALLTLTCSSGPSAGELEIDLTTTNGDTEAVRFTITASESKMIESASPACSGCQVFTARLNDGDLRGVVTGDIQSGPLLRVLVSDVDAAGAYNARVTEAANGAFILLGVEDYNLVVQKP